ncbi:MAG: long-chain fatty acid--CoA ligase [Chloroflexia bacterium]
MVTQARPGMGSETTTQPVADPATRPWIARYAAGVPATIAYPDVTLPAAFKDAVARFGDLTAASFLGSRLSYRALERWVAQFANRLRQFGLRPGDRVLLLLPNSPQFLIAYFGTLAAGGIVVPLSPLLVESEIETLAQQSGARIAVALDLVYDKLAGLWRRGVLAKVVVATLDEFLAPHRRLLFPLAARAAWHGPVGDDPARGLYRFRRLLQHADERPPTLAGQPDDVAVLVGTGGTTGLPKLVMLTHRNLIANALQVRHWIPALRERAEVNLAIAPFFHAYGLTTGVNLAMLLGAEQVLLPRFDTADTLAAIRTYRPTVFPGVPMLFAAISAAVRQDPSRARDLASLRHCISGAAALPEATREEFERLTGARVVEGYGLTEASPVLMAGPFDGTARHGSIGLPFPDTEVRLVDPETGRDAPPGARGELLARGPQVMRGYWERPEETARVLQDGWLHTGDVVTMDADGFFYLVDRTKDVIITGGENVYPREIEEVLLQHPQIAEVAVVGVPHSLAGQIARAYVVCRPGATLTRRDLLRYCRERLAKYKVPRQIEFRDSLPRSYMGKVLRRELTTPSPATTTASPG